MERPETVRIKEMVKQTPTVLSVFFKAPAIASVVKPGQFVMVWVPRLDEIPLSVSSVEGDTISITIKRVGEATEAIHGMEVGDYLGLKGPYGNGFNLDHKRVLLVAGGVGIASLALVPKHHNNHSAIIAAKNKHELFWVNKFKDFNICTDDGSLGKKAFAHELLAETLKQHKFDSVLCCGPEIMIQKCLEVCQKHRTHFQASLERFMKCGFGLCGSCVLDPHGLRVCKEGPVFDGTTLAKTVEFGKYKRNSSGTKVTL